MASSAAAEGPEDVNDFLARIKELGEKRDREDAERTSKLEEDIAEGRRRRAARRADRERSLSPEKSSQVASPTASYSRRKLSRSDSSTPTLTPAPIPRLTPSSSSTQLDSTAPPAGPSKTEDTVNEPPPKPPKPSSASSGVPSRANTLSWQQRPTSVRGPRNRPLSLVDRSAPTQPTQPSPTTKQRQSDVLAQDDAPSKREISQTLGAKDPSWFRQTADRGAGSPAYRKATEDAPNPIRPASSDRHALHGLSRESTPDLSTSRLGDASKTPDQSFSHTSPSEPRPSDSAVESEEQDRASSLFSEPSLRFPQPGPSTINLLNEADRPSDNTSSERPKSPTKGVGGFVESAMLKRSDSVNKRWSAQATTGLNRQNSNTRDRGTGPGMPTSLSMPKLGESSRELSVESESRPASGHSTEGPSRQESVSRANARQHLRSEPRANLSRDPSPSKNDDSGPPSPSKRWSPVKSSWLESALSKPESPQATPSLAHNQPSWMVELNKAKQQRSSKDQGQVASAFSPPKLEPSSSKGIPVLKPVEIRRGADPKVQTVDEHQNDNDAPIRKSMKSTDSVSPTTSKPPRPTAMEVKGAQEEESSATISSELGQALARNTEEDVPTSKPTPPKPSTLTSSKPKPTTPSKKDFRSSLKSRDSPAEKPKSDGLEFQNAFGKLKRTQTQNYKAPDELKDNILRGKTGLAVTGGPQKTARRDELKEDLLKQKEVMKSKASEAPKETPHGRKVSGTTTPEAIAKKRALGTNESSGNIMSSPSKSIAEIETEQTAEPSKGMSVAEKQTSDPRPEPLKKISSNKFADRFNPALAGVLARGPGPPSTTERALKSPSPTEPVEARRSVDGTQDIGASGSLEHKTKARARGPKRRLPTTTAPDSSNFQPEGSTSSPAVRAASHSKPTPAAKPRNVTPTIAQPQTPATVPAEHSTSPKPAAPPKSPDLARKASTTVIKNDPQQTSPDKNTFPKAAFPLSPPLPSKPSKPSGLRSTSSEISNGDVLPPPVTEQAKESEEAPRVSVKNASAVWGQKQGQTSSTSKEPIKLPTRKDEEGREAARTGVASIAQVDSVSVLPHTSADASSPSRISRTPKPDLASKPSAASLSSAKSRGTKPTEPPKPTTPSSTIQRTPSSQASEAATMFRDFFGELPVAPRELEVDTQKILTSNATASPKIKTLRKQISELSQDLKTTPLPSGQEHVLHSSRMYICTHVFGDETGARVSEVYLWTGSSVADSTLEDAQLFAKKAAKDDNAKLIVFRQGKEPSNFFQALGGIVITRKSSGDDRYILCGRQHLGHLAFDEVPYSPSSLCSGFPYIIVADSETVYLWKGSGCTTDELSGARLISMDMCPTGSVAEVTDGQEDASFLSLFPSTKDTTIPRSADHWKHKPNHPNYRSRLYHVEWHERPVSSHSSGPAQTLWGMVRRQSQPAPTHLRIAEIAPFTQGDIESENIYVLDAFFEIYIIISPLTIHKPHAFASALLFAQEYGILAASTDNRPFVPPGTIVLEGVPRDLKALGGVPRDLMALEGVPRDLKAVVRGWDDSQRRSGDLMAGSSGGLGRDGRGKSGGVRVCGLGAGVAAVRGGG